MHASEETVGNMVPADPHARRLTLILVLGVGAFGAATLWLLDRYVPLNADPQAGVPEALVPRIRLITRGLSVAIAVTGIATAIYLRRLFMRVKQAGRYPPPGMKLVRPVRLRQGPAAERIALLGFTLAAAFLVASSVASVLLWVIVDRVLSG